VIAHPAIAALRSDPASQRQAQATMDRAAEDWRAGELAAALHDDLARHHAGTPLEECSALAAVFADALTGLAFARHWAGHFLTALRDAPLGEVPFQHRCSAGYSTIRLLTSGSASLNLSAYEQRDRVIEPETAVFVDRESVELVLSGTGRGTVHDLQSSGTAPGVATARRTWKADDRINCSDTRSRQFVAVEGAMLVLQVIRAPARPAPTREFRLADGALVRSASGDKMASRAFLALGVLGALQAEGSGEAMANIALDRQREPDLRWEGARQLLAHDPRRGFEVLLRLAANADDPLTAPAQSLQRQLLAAYPQLREVA
jgi:hypothetical protein